MKDRITEFLIKENISPTEFADKIGVQRSSVSHVLNGRNYPGASFIQKMLHSFKNLNPRWLLLGEGPMLEMVKLKEPSLFSFSQMEDIPSNENGSIKKIESKNPDEIPTSEKIDHRFETTDSSNSSVQKILKQDMQNMIEQTIVSKEIEKIIFFYTDKSFSIYSPSK